MADRPADRPVVMGADSVRAILAGRKTQSRRVLRERDAERLGLGLVGIAARIAPGIRPAPIVYSGCPYGAAGSRLWVRETFYCDHCFVGDPEKTTNAGRVGPRVEPDRASCEREWRHHLVYRADGEAADHYPENHLDLRWRSPIHMPRWASRITLEITAVRVERVQAISETDARAEGVRSDADEIAAAAGLAHLRGSDAARALPSRLRSARDNFRDAWDAINGRRAGCSWAASPWVWVLEFRRVEAT